VREVCEELGLGMVGLGFDPTSRRADISWMPKGRYRIMREYMPKKGQHGIDMMLRTCTVQANLDYQSEADMAKKFRVGLALQPVTVALLANSPFTEGEPNSYQSFRSFVWMTTDPDRCGTLPFVFEDGFGFERYVDYLLDVPMYFVYRNGRYIDASGQSFRDFLAGQLPALPGELPTLTDWLDHSTTAFPEVRLKTFLEMRGADSGSWRRLCALPAFWVGLFYDQTALDAAYDLIRDWTEAEREAMRAEVPKLGLDARIRSRTLRDVALEVLDMARDGLHRRGHKDRAGEDETHFLDTLFSIAGTGRSPALELLDDFATRWKGDLARVYDERSF
jgi:glutamate--cysteine ligase